ncbi:hypothetical protein FACS189437_06310 [Bacteroidia bacterium]|nr:hypothetical protein FACS189437_06310 [Bacteroidia bacterium]
MKNLITVVVFLLCFRFSFSAPIDVDKASKIAKEFSQKENLQKAPVKTGSAELSVAYSCPDYFVFDKTGQGGFILISGDDRTVPVLGYSDYGNFDLENLPENFKDWLSTIQKEIQYLKETAPATNFILPLLQTKNTSYATSVAPLLGEISWNQDNPYYNLCPMDGNRRSYTGCVATAMAQIMRYHQWPARGKGSHQYTSRTRRFELSVDFSQSVYDWDNMTGKYDNRSTDIEKDAVAKLMYDCGVAVNMDYTNYGSGAYSEDVARALPEYFDYDKNIQIYHRDYFTYSEWINLIKEELNHQRPLYISGTNTEAGHAFVCDGYDAEDLFHINWGWGGTSNGYFVISILNPYTQGIGGSSGGYNFTQAIIAGIQPPATDSKVSYPVYLEYDFTTDNFSIARNQEVFLNTTILRNRGANDFDGKIAAGLYQNNNLIEIFDSKTVDIQSNRWTNISWNFDIPTSIPDGTYELYPVCKGNDETDWSIIRSSSMVSSHLGIVISDETIDFFIPASAQSQLSIPEGGFTCSDLYTNSPATFHVSIENTGKEAYTEMGILLTDENYSFYEWIAGDMIAVPQNETVTIDLSGHIPVPPGTYTAVLFYTTYTSMWLFEGESVQTVVVNRLPATAPELAFEGQPGINSTEVAKGGQMTVSAVVQNTGLPTSGEMYVIIYKSTGGTYLKTYHQSISLPQDESVSFQMDVPVDLNEGKYYLKFQYQETGGHYRKPFSEQVNFVVVDGTAIHEISGMETVRFTRIFNINGVQVPAGNLAPGIYLMQIKTDQGTTIKKFIKQ